jgi:hypothetical protein
LQKLLAPRVVESILSMYSQGCYPAEIVRQLRSREPESDIYLSKVLYWLKRKGVYEMRRGTNRPIDERFRWCGCKISIYQRCLAIKVCPDHADGKVDKTIHQLAQLLFGVSDLKFGGPPPESTPKILAHPGRIKR